MRWLLVLLVPTVAHAAPCDGKKLAKALVADFEVVPARPFRCTQVRGKHPLVLVESPIDPKTGMGFAAVVDAATEAVRWQRSSSVGTPSRTSAFAIADLDGDGQDEILVHDRSTGHDMTGDESLFVLTVRGGTVVEAGTLALADHGHGSPCNGTWAIVGGPHGSRRVQITGVHELDRTHDPVPSSCPPEGVHRYRWTGTAFALAD
jgi:hypothetical protein